MMVRALKYIAIIIVATTMVYALIRLQSCEKPDQTEEYVAIPPDTNFAPVVHQTYRPPSLPFSKKSSGVTLPKGLSESDVKRVIRVGIKDVRDEKIVDVIETREGQVYVYRDSSIFSLRVLNFEPAVFRLGLRFGIGIDLAARNQSARVSPAAVFAPFQWLGFVHLPTIVADLEGVGVGGQIRLYHDIFFGAARIWRYDEGTQAKITLVYML